VSLIVSETNREKKILPPWVPNHEQRHSRAKCAMALPHAFAPTIFFAHPVGSLSPHNRGIVAAHVSNQ
jgi:hypothetical protein